MAVSRATNLSSPLAGLVDRYGRLDIYAAIGEFEEEREKTQKDMDDVLKDVKMTKRQLFDYIKRTKCATKYLLSLLPQLDDADKNRLARASEPDPWVPELEEGESDCDE